MPAGSDWIGGASAVPADGHGGAGFGQALAKLPKPSAGLPKSGTEFDPGSIDPDRPGVAEPRPFEPRLPSRKSTPSRGVLPCGLPNVHACSRSIGTRVIGKSALLNPRRPNSAATAPVCLRAHSSSRESGR